ncbi:hypothetical protein DVR12_03255 [Chitinophaga silvatica]|uniref:DUF4595 domain-containing protein n=1 Tax=Chitinophaga silvatica TaxID=2282649 RepID=A0A3E1YHH0_9BACT|nr:hypothetical protein [Chitinophaga silvatica]RFS26816.1 hypothetical protein DVR12_03255 [Chitinophaga silvatica]
MRRSILPIAFILVLTLQIFQSCKKNEEEPPVTNKPGDSLIAFKLVRAIHWTDGIEAEVLYNTDSTLKQINYSLASQTSSTIFEWENKKIKTIFEDKSLYQSTYSYDNGRISNYVIGTKQPGYPVTHKMEFSYNTNGQPNKLKFSTTNEAGTQLKTETTYEYNSGGDLIKITTINGNSIITDVIDQYSDSVVFNPLIFVAVGLAEGYTINNLPVLSRMTKFPAKIVRTIKNGNDPAYIDRVSENICKISNKQIDTIKAIVTFPKTPQGDRNVTAAFEYK